MTTEFFFTVNGEKIIIINLHVNGYKKKKLNFKKQTHDLFTCTCNLNCVIES